MQEKNRRYRVKITETAWEMLIEHARFLANVSIPAADRMFDTFAEITAKLVAMPERNPWLEHPAFPFQRYRKLLFGKHYVALYEIQNDTIYVVAVVDCRQNYNWML